MVMRAAGGDDDSVLGIWDWNVEAYFSCTIMNV